MIVAFISLMEGIFIDQQAIRTSTLALYFTRGNELFSLSLIQSAFPDSG